jgi:hypothetical protein
MADITTQRNFICNSFSAVVAGACAQFVDWAENVVGTLKAFSSASFNSSSAPTYARYVWTWTDTSMKTHEETWTFYFGFSVGSDTPLLAPAPMIAAQPGFSVRCAVDMSAPGLQGYSTADVSGWWQHLAPNMVTELINYFGTTDQNFIENYGNGDDVVDSSLNRLSRCWRATGLQGDFPVFYSAVITMLNVDPMGTKFDGIVDFNYGQGAGCQTGSGSNAQIVDALNLIAMKDYSISLNRGASVFNVQGGVAG